jgi:hypothetical protein
MFPLSIAETPEQIYGKKKQNHTEEDMENSIHV